MQEQNSVVSLPNADVNDIMVAAVSPMAAAPRWIAQVTLILAFAGFIGLGLVSSRLGVTWPAMQATFKVPIDAIGILLIAQLVGSVVVSASSGRITAWLNIGVVLAWSCGITAVALLGAGATPSWAILVILSLLTGVGAGLIESSLNSYAATHFTPRSMNWLHASFGVGATLGLTIMTAAVAGSLGWRSGFIVVGVIELVLALCFAISSRYWQSPVPRADHAPHEQSAPLTATLRLPVVWLAVALFSVFSGAQGSAGQWYFSLLTEQRGISAALAGTWISMLWGSLTVGRIIFGFVVHRVAPIKIMRACMVAVLVSTIVFWLNPTPWLNAASIVLLGLAMAPLYPLLTSATPRYVGAKHAANGVGLQVAAAGLGGVLLTSLVGILARSFGLGVIAPTLVVAAVLMVALFEMLARHLPGTSTGQVAE